MQGGEPRILLAEALQRAREGVKQSVDQLEHREIDVGERVADHEGVAGRILFQHALEILHELRNPVVDEIMRARFRGVFLVFVVEAGRKRVMRVVGFGHHVGDSQLQAVCDVAQAFHGRREIQARSEIKEDVRGLRDHQVAVFQKRRSERRIGLVPAFHDRHHRAGAETFGRLAARHFDIVRAGFFQREPHKFATALQAVPIVEFQAHRSVLIRVAGRVCGTRRACCCGRWRCCFASFASFALFAFLARQPVCRAARPDAFPDARNPARGGVCSGEVRLSRRSAGQPM